MGLFNFSGKKGETKKAEVAKGSNEYTDLFAKKDEAKKPEKESKVIDSVAADESGDNEKRNLLNIKKDKLDTSTFIDQDYHLRKKLSFARGFFFFLVFTSVSLLSYFFIELHPSDFLHNYIDADFAPNSTATLENLNKKIASTQTKINRNRHLVAKVNLDNFSLVSDQFLQDYDVYVSDESSFIRDQADDRLFESRKKLTKSFETAKEKLLATNWVDFGADPTELNFDPENETDKAIKHKVHFVALLKEHFNERKDNEDLKAVASEKEVNGTLQLIGNGALNLALKQNDFSELDYAGVTELIDEVNSSVTNELSNIYKIKRDRVMWSEVIRQIDVVTESLDFYYENDFFEQIGGIQYSNYQFDSDSGRVVVTGQVRSDDGSNFSIMANLVDKFEESGMFDSVDMRSFSKSGSEDEGYSSTVKLDFSLQENAFDKRDNEDLFDDSFEVQSIENERKVRVIKKVKRK